MPDSVGNFFRDAALVLELLQAPLIACDYFIGCFFSLLQTAMHTCLSRPSFGILESHEIFGENRHSRLLVIKTIENDPNQRSSRANKLSIDAAKSQYSSSRCPFWRSRSAVGWTAISANVLRNFLSFVVGLCIGQSSAAGFRAAVDSFPVFRLRSSHASRNFHRIGPR